ncbi:MAG: thiamine diphosphokinase [Candidatus Cloacimonetes bacterium]|nr:thiamine diphosphokinase [Candidatus Cloacimonadota bacterium]
MGVKPVACCAFIVCGDGRIDIARLLADRCSDDLLIAADSGANCLLAAGFMPDIVVGDMDSVQDDVLERLQGQSQLLAHPADKDFTDAELALRLAVERGATEVALLNDLGGLFDHALGVVALLFVARSLGVKAHIRNDNQRVWLVDGHWRLSVGIGAIVSLLPWSDEALVLATEGLRWPLHNENLLRSATRGISNEATHPTIEVAVASGDLLAVVTLGEKA